MRLRSLRARVAAAAAVAIVVAIVVLGGAVLALVGRDLRSSLDTTLSRRAADVARLSATAPALLTAPGALEAPLSGAQLLVEIVDRHGSIVARSAALSTTVLPGSLHTATARAIAGARPAYLHASLAGAPVRAYVAPLPDTGGPAAGGAVIVAASTGSIDSTLRRLRLLVVVAAAAAAALGAVVALLATRRALRPLRDLSLAAARIQRTRDPSQRLPAPRSGDEVDRLAGTLNEMLAALESARDAERRFLADASHELRTPLTALRGNAAYVARHGADRDALEGIERDAERLTGLLDDLLALAREDAAPAVEEPVRLDELARAAADAEPQVVVDAPQPVAVTGDGAALARALANLVENARIHGPPGGPITVAARLEGDRAVLSVADEGEGIPPADVERAFARFWRSPDARVRPGSGLGLAIVKATAERHGGAVRVDGARVSLVLPAAPAPLRRSSGNAPITRA